jgi:Na+-transporting methylmalonyl-CoA/oxaloacetate decarboxylase gamma subunit
LSYSFVDLDGIPRYEGQEFMSLAAGESAERELSFALPKDSFGEFNFNMIFSDGLISIEASKGIFLPSQKGLTGLIISDDNALKLTTFGIVIGVVVILVFVVWGVKNFKRKTKKISVKPRKVKKRRKDLIDVEV